MVATHGYVVGLFWTIQHARCKTNGSKGDLGSRGPHLKVCPLCVPTNEVHHADILTEVYAIVSLGLQV